MRVTIVLSNLMLVTVLATTLALGAATAHAEDGATDSPPGSITFVGKNMVATANGTFHKWHFTKADFDPDHPENSEVAIEVDVASIDTKIEKRDDHLRTADFFDVENYPTATLRIYEIVASGTSEDGNPQFSAKLDWAMHGVQKTYENFSFELTGKSPVQVKGTFTINRMDFNIGEKHRSLNPMSIQEEIPIVFEATVPETL